MGQRRVPDAVTPGRPSRPAGEGRLVENLMFFARVLRAAGLPIGPGRVLDAVRAVETVGITSRDDFYWTLHSVFVNRARHRELFDQAFHLFWRNPRLLERTMSVLLPAMPMPGSEPAETINRRLAEALGANVAATPDAGDPEREIEVDAVLTWSDREVLRTKDFEQMTVDELAAAKAAISAMRLPLEQVATRRFRVHPHGRRIDARASLRSALRSGGSAIPLLRKRHRVRPPPLVVLCDVSGSMTRYARLLLHFAHALTGDRERVFSFVFGTRLTNISRLLREKDVDVALAKVAGAVADWDGGTRIGRCLRDFNHGWSRRVLAQGAVVLLITDGLDRDAGDGLEREVDRLHRSCRRLIWLNPLLRYDRFEPKALGIRAILPHVDDFRPAHNLESLSDLTAALSRPSTDSAVGPP